MALSDRYTADVVRPLFVAWLDFTVDPIRAWTGPGDFSPSSTGDTDLDGNTFLGVEGAVAMSEIHEGLSGTSPLTITYSAHNLTAPGLLQIVADDRIWLKRKAVVWVAFLQDDQASVHPEVERLFAGVMVNADSTRKFGEPAKLEITMDLNLRKSGDATTRLTDHKRFNATDTATTRIVQLANGTLNSVQFNPRTSGGGAGPGSNSRSGGGGRNFHQQ